MTETKKELCKMIISIIVAALSAIGTSLGITSCMAAVI